MPIAPRLDANRVYKEFNLVKSFSIILRARNRHLRIVLFYNTSSNSRASSSAITHLPSFLRQKFGKEAVGVLVGDTVFKNDEELMRDGSVRTNESYYVVYADYTPSYSTSLLQPPVYDDNRASAEVQRYLPGYHDTEVTTYLKPAYFEELVYYPSIPLITKTINIKLSFGRTAQITLTNMNVEHADNFRHELYLKAGYKAQGIMTKDRTIYTTDEILWCDEIVHGGTYKLVTGTGYSLIPSNRPQQAPPARILPGRDALGSGIRRISSSTTRSMHRVTSGHSQHSIERYSSPVVRAK